MFTAYTKDKTAIVTASDFESTKAGAMQWFYDNYPVEKFNKWIFDKKTRTFYLYDVYGNVLAYIPGLTAKRG